MRLPHRTILALALLLTSLDLVRAQIPGDAFDQLNTAIGQRVETAVVLGTADAITTGGYKWRLDSATGDITRATWEFNLGDNQFIGNTDMMYVWDCDGGVGYSDYKDEFLTGDLAGNTDRFQSYALGSDLGPRFFLTRDISVMPQLGAIYGYTVNTFNNETSIGNEIVQSSLVNWNVSTLSVTPSLQGQYSHVFFGTLKVQARTNYSYYWTFPLARSTEALSFRSNSEVWQNSIDLDYDTRKYFLGCSMHLGGTVSRTDLFDGIRAAIDVSNYYNVSGRIYLDTAPKNLLLSKLGLSASYTWGNGFHGYAFGVVIDVLF